MKQHKKDLQSFEIQSLQAGEMIESLSTPKDSILETKWKTISKSIFDYWVEYKEGKYTPDVWYQRLYRFYDVVGGDGDKWQRKLVASMISFEPLPFIWVNQLESIRHIIDGGQRTRVIDGWFRNCIRLPKNTRVFFKGELLNLSEKNWSDIQKYHPTFAEYWKSNYKLFIQQGQNLSDELCAEQFEKLNDGNEMAKQEFRTSIISGLNKFVLDKSNYESPNALKIFQRKNLISVSTKKYWESNLHGITFAKRGFDAFVAKVFYMVMTDYSKALSEPNITDMYYSEKDIEFYNRENPSKPEKTQLEKYKSKVNLVLKWVDDLLVTNTSAAGALSANEIYMLLHTKFQLEQTYEFKVTNGKQFLDSYRRIITAFKTDDDLSWKNKKWHWVNFAGQPTSFTKSLSSMASGQPSEFRDWRGIVAKEFINMFNNSESTKNIGFTLSKKKDTKRVYTSTEKKAMASVQDFECMYFEYCGNHIDGINETIAGDHSSVSHTKGGKTTIENGAACCTDCNREKSSLSHDEFLMILKMRGLSDDDIERIDIRKNKVLEYASELA